MMLKFSLNENLELDFKEAIKKPIPVKCLQINEPFEVETMEGTMKGKAGDWLMIGVKGEKYVCDKAIFEETYEICK
ncbi:PGDYG domain-containing protein [Mariniflexile sp.]|uniref:PGDYG domain-containing protein n=1 Tax=Mariniflexile sp. TaxID=1979402 RepID=UPI00356587C3